MKPIILIITALILFALAGTSIFYFQKFSQVSGKNYVCVKNNCYLVELAQTPVHRQKGLMNRSQLGEGRGMLFIFPESGNYSFWMKNTLIPLDIIWIDGSRHIVSIAENASPCRADFCPPLDPKASARYVLEVNAGQMSAIGAKIGDSVDINIVDKQRF